MPIEKNKKTQENKKDVKKDKKKAEEELSEEDKALKEKIDLLVSSLLSLPPPTSSSSLLLLKNEVKTSTTSMTSVPKPFKFLKSHYVSILAHYRGLFEDPREEIVEYRKNLADFLSVLSMVMSEPEEMMSLKLLMEGSLSEYTTWGHEYIHHLSGQIGIEYNKRIEEGKETEDLISLVRKMVPQFVADNAEADAIDLLLEVDRLGELRGLVTKDNFERVFVYLMNCALYSADSDEMLTTLKTTYEICIDREQFSNALIIAIKLDDVDLMKNVFNVCQDQLTQKQLAFQLGRQKLVLPDLPEALSPIYSNSKLSTFYLQLAKDLEVLEPKHPDQIYKTHLENKKSSAIDSARMNQAASFVNAFVNAGMGKDALMIDIPATETPWINKVKNEGLISAAASIGMIFMWDSAGASKHINDYLELTDGYAKMGACLAIGLSNNGIIDECDLAKAILEEKINSREDHSRLGSIVGLGLAYAGSGREDLLDLLLPIVIDNNYSNECSALAALSLGLIFVGKCNEDVGNGIYQALTEKDEAQLNMSISRYFGVALGLLFLAKQEKCEAILEAIKTISHPISKYIEICIESCAYVGSGNVLKVQQFFHHCVFHDESDKEAKESKEAKDGNQPNKESTKQEWMDWKGLAVIGLGLVASSEEIGNEMALRSLNHILQYGDIGVKRAVPLSLAILNISNPKITVMDLLTKLSHDQDDELAFRSIIALGLIGAGTNNSRLSGILRQLASYYGGDNSLANHLYLVRIAQGLLHMGKGLITIQPYYQDKFLLNGVGMAGLIVLLNGCLDMTNIILGKYSYILYYLGLSMYPRMLFTLNDNLENFPIPVRVGQAVDVVGQAGQPKKITGFQTHTSPVILAYGERAELGTEEYIPYCDMVLENFVILKKNPNYNPEEENVKVRHKKSVS